MKKFTLIIATVVISLISSQHSNAQNHAFNSRVLKNHVKSQHLYRDKLLKDEYRPVYHFAVPEGFAFPMDPNGAFYWKGRYHLFYIFQPVEPKPYYRGDAWAHISSHDLVHWRFHPTALKPNDQSPERAIYSGNMFLDKQGVPTIMYHGLGAGNCIAQGTQDRMLNNWVKHKENPVIPHPEFALDNDQADYRSILDEYPDYGEYDVWDPHCWLEGDTYYSISGDNDVWPGQKTALYKSKNLKDWELVGDFFHHGNEQVKGRLDCPDFFKLDGKYVLLYLRNGLKYFVGEFKNEQFYPEQHGTMTWESGVGYAPETLLDDQGRRIMWASLYDTRTGWGEVNEFITKHGWCGTLTMPRVLSLDKNNQLQIKPVKELQSLRFDPVHKKHLSVKNSEVTLNGVKGNALELKFTIDPGNAEEFGIRVCKSPEGKEQTTISCNMEDDQVLVDLSKTSLNKDLMAARYEEHNYLQKADLELSGKQKVSFHIFIDHSVMEIFVNNKLCLTHRIYPTLNKSRGVSIYSDGGTIEIPIFKSWKMNPSNPF